MSDDQGLLILEYRKRAVEFLESVVPAQIGSAASLKVSQGRYERYSKYYGCADLAHAMYAALGLKSPHINRDDEETPEDEWRTGRNVSLLSYWPAVASGVESDCWSRVDGGDVLIRWLKPDTSDAHVVCVGNNNGKTLSTFEFGQPRPLIGRAFERQIYNATATPHFRPWQRWLPLPAVMIACGVLEL